jgi:hypothetical protein
VVVTSRSNTTAWEQAARVRTHLANGGRLMPVTGLPRDVAGLPREADEYVVGMFAGNLTYQRWSAASVSYVSGGPAFIVGSEPFVAGYAMGAMVNRARQRRKVRRMAEPQWRSTPLRRLVVTTRRLWCEVMGDSGPQWRRFNFETITRLELADDTAVLSFQDSEPLRLGGEWMPWCAVVVDHFRHLGTVPLTSGSQFLVSS